MKALIPLIVIFLGGIISLQAANYEEQSSDSINEISHSNKTTIKTGKKIDIDVIVGSKTIDLFELNMPE